MAFDPMIQDVITVMLCTASIQGWTLSVIATLLVNSRPGQDLRR